MWIVDSERWIILVVAGLLLKHLLVVENTLIGTQAIQYLVKVRHSFSIELSGNLDKWYRCV